MFHKILVPLDGSELSEQALPLAMKLAEAGQTEIVLLRSSDCCVWVVRPSPEKLN